MLNTSAWALVVRSTWLLPLSTDSATVGVLMVVSLVNVRLAVPTLPAASVSVTTTVCEPSAKAFVVALSWLWSLTALPSIVTAREFAPEAMSVLTVNVASLLRRSPAVPLSVLNTTVGAGAVVSTV